MHNNKEKAVYSNIIEPRSFINTYIIFNLNINVSVYLKKKM
jgi:hypothetical protein